MHEKEKVTLTKEQATLLIPLHAKGEENPIFDDPKARQILASVQYDFAALNIPAKTAVTLRIRASQLDRYARAFLRERPRALVLHLGCGLDSRCLRVEHPQALWYDLDMPDVIDLRRRFYSESDSYHMLASSVTAPGWLDAIPTGLPTLVIAEGLLMYLRESEVRDLFLRLRQKFPGAHIAFDAFSLITVRRISAHPSLQKTGASIHWGIDQVREIETWANGITLNEEWFFSQSPDIARLSWPWRFMFRLAAGIPAARNAQRLLYYTL